jgi:hypothetical protein
LKCAPPPLTWNPGSAPVYTGIMTITCLPFTGKCRYFESLNSRRFDLCFAAVLICRYFENTENVAIMNFSLVK